MMYRATKKMPHSTQCLSVLNAMRLGYNSISEIPTGQGKGLISALYASMMWLEGKTVDVCTSNTEQASADLKEYSPFYDLMGIKHGKNIITEASDQEDYCRFGVNYSDVPQLALFRACMEIEGKEEKDSNPSLVLDEADFTVLDDSTLYRYAVNLGFSLTDVAKNELSWIYPLINEFIKTVAEHEDWSAKDDIEQTKAYIMRNATEAQKKQLNELFDNDAKLDKKLDVWIDSSLAAMHLAEDKKQFVIESENKIINGVPTTVSAAHIMIHDRPSKRAQWSNGVHQFFACEIK